jgi:16S rRNA (guanine527-N7)-methyltransferase
LKNVNAQHIRAEEIKGKKFDAILSRAVAPLGELWKWAEILLNPKARFEVDAGNILPVPHGLICLKGGDLAAEISASGTRPKLMEVFELFKEEYFRGKYILYIPHK